MERKLLVSIPEYYNGGLVPQNFEDFMEHIHRPGGYWQVLQRDKYSGEVQTEQWIQNCYTDNGVTVMFKALAGASTPSTVPASIIAIDASLGNAGLGASVASGGTVTSLTLNTALFNGPTIPSGTKLVVNPGTGNTLTVVTTASITSASSSVTVTSTPGPGSTIANGATIRYDYTAVPTSDPSSLSAPVSYTSSMPGGQFTYTITTGYGNRTLAVTNNTAYLFSTTGSPVATAGSYTAARLVTTNPLSAATQSFLYAPFDAPLVISSSSNGQVNINEKL